MGYGALVPWPEPSALEGRVLTTDWWGSPHVSLSVSFLKHLENIYSFIWLHSESLGMWILQWQHVGSSSRGSNPCLTPTPIPGTQSPSHWTTREVPVGIFWISVFVFSGIHPGVEFLGHMIVLFLVFWESSMLFSTVVVPIYIPTSNVHRFTFLHILAHPLLFVFFLIIAILMYISGERCYLIVVLICIYLMISDVEHPVPVGHLQVFFGKITIVVLPI